MQYYIGDGNERRGPFERDQLLAQGVQSETLIWHQGLSNWVRAVEVTEIKTLLASVPPPIPPITRSRPKTASAKPAVNSSPTAFNALPTNSALSPMANAICIFTIVLSPVFWIFGTVGALAGLPTTPTEYDVASFFLGLLIFGPISLAITILLTIGGLRLRDLRSSGLRLIKIGIWCDLALSALQLVAVVLLLASLNSENDTSASPNMAATLIGMLEASLGLCGLVFEVVALVWLYRHQNEVLTSG
jgi:hypothetical protein